MFKTIIIITLIIVIGVLIYYYVQIKPARRSFNIYIENDFLKRGDVIQTPVRSGLFLVVKIYKKKVDNKTKIRVTKYP